MQNIYVKYFSARSVWFCVLVCIFSPKISAQRIVAIHQYEGTTCDETAIHPDEDITLFRQVFGHEFLGGWERFTYDEIETSTEFLDGTCLLYLDGFCDKDAFSAFYELYYDSIQQFVFNGGNLYINTQGEFYYGFDSVECIWNGSASAFIYDTLNPLVRGPFVVPFGYFSSDGGYFFNGSFSSPGEIDLLLRDTVPYGDDYPMVRFDWGQGEVVLSSFFQHKWEEVTEEYKNLRRNILYYLSGCVRGTQNAGIYHVLSPMPECNLTNAEELQVMVYNFGYDTIYNIDACYRIEGGTTTCELFPIILPPQDFDTLVFTTPADLSQCGYNTIEAWTQVPGDSDLYNDTLTHELLNICALLSDSGIPDTVCISAPIIQAKPQAGHGTWSGVGIIDEELGLFDPALVGEDNYSVITYSYDMPIDYTWYTIPYDMPDLIDPINVDVEDYDADSVAFGFDFSYFNQTFDHGYICSNGFLKLGYSWCVIWPAMATIPNIISLVGSNLIPAWAGDVWAETQGAAPNRKFIFYFEDVFSWEDWTTTVNAAAILYEKDGAIEFHTHRIPEVEAGGYWQYICNEDSTIYYKTLNLRDGANDTAFRFEPILCSRTITDTIFVTGNVSVPVLGNDTTFCPGGELTIGTNYPGTGHLWNTGDTTSHITITEGGTYTLQLHYGPGDCWLYDTITVTTVEQDLYEDVLGTDTTLCSGDSLTIELPEGYLSYSWGSGTTDSSLVITETEVIVLELEYQSGCSLFDTLSVNIREPIEVTFEVTPSPDSGPGGNIIVLPSNGTPPYTITWNDAFLSGDTIIGTWPGTYILTVTDANGCSVVDTVVVPIGTEISADQSDILVFPIPFSNLLQVSSTDLVWKIRVYTADGKLLYQHLPDQNFISIKTGSWPPGFYVMEIHTISTTLVTYVTKW